MNIPPPAAREIALDVETTGLDPDAGDRVVEIGCVELHQQLPSGREYQAYVNPERAMSEAARAITGLRDEFLQTKPRFADVAPQFLAFIGDSRLVIHNAEFDMKFLNAELARLDLPLLSSDRVTDSLTIAREKFLGQPNSLDALCRRFNIDVSARTKHGALLDAQLLAEVYLDLRGGRQRRLGLDGAGDVRARAPAPTAWPALSPRPEPLPLLLSAKDREAHLRFVQDALSDALWLAPSE